MSKRKSAKVKARAKIKTNGRPDRIPVPDEFCQQLIDIGRQVKILQQKGDAIMQTAANLLKIPLDYELDTDQKAFVPPADAVEAKA